MWFAHNFRPGKLRGHYFDHALDFGPISQKEYLQKARSFLNKTADGIILQEGRRGLGWGWSTGDRIRFDVITQEFGIATRDGYIRTYYIPEPTSHGYPTNLDYFLSQF